MKSEKTLGICRIYFQKTTFNGKGRKDTGGDQESKLQYEKPCISEKLVETLSWKGMMYKKFYGEFPVV